MKIISCFYSSQKVSKELSQKILKKNKQFVEETVPTSKCYRVHKNFSAKDSRTYENIFQNAQMCSGAAICVHYNLLSSIRAHALNHDKAA